MVMCLSYVAVAVARQRLPARGWRVSACPPEAEAAGVDLTHSPIRSPVKVALRKNRGAPLTHSLTHPLLLSNRIRRRNESAMTEKLGHGTVPILTAGHGGGRLQCPSSLLATGAPAQSSSSLGVPLTRRPHCHHRSGRQRPTDGRLRPRTPGEATSLRLLRLGADTFPHCS